MKFRVLGSVGAEVDGRYHSIPGARQRALLATLLVQGGHLVPTEQLYTELWGDNPPTTVENAFQANVSRLRRTLRELGGDEGAPPLITRASGYVLDIAPDQLDMSVFRERILRSRAAMSQDPARAGRLLEEALSLWRGAPLQDVVAGPLCQSVVLQLDEEYLCALEDKLWLGIEFEDPTFAVAELKRMSVVHPWRERITEMLMLALYRCGRQAEAIETYNSARGRLIDELGMEPSPQLKQRFREILNQAPSLHHSSRALLHSH